jgi:hypothetical protein
LTPASLLSTVKSHPEPAWFGIAPCQSMFARSVVASAELGSGCEARAAAQL